MKPPSASASGEARAGAGSASRTAAWKRHPMSEAALASLAWPESAAVAALEALARKTGLLTGETRLPARLGPLGDRLERAGAILGLELEPVEVAGGELAS